jgi:SagB-type dehydrogenase family enzyme
MRLPQPKTSGEISVEEALVRRRSKRHFAQKELTWEQISQLLWACQGITENGFRTAPSAGALYPLEVYLVTKEGISHYQPEEHSLKSLLKEDQRHQLCQAALNRQCIKEAPASIVITAVFQQVESRYRERAIRYVYLEAGHAAQNIHLQAVALGLGSVPIGAFYDEKVQQVLSLPENHHPIYIIPIGY